jgi:hypothetical protein
MMSPRSFRPTLSQTANQGDDVAIGPVQGAGGFRISDGFISALDLVGIGLLSASEAEELHVRETADATAGR